MKARLAGSRASSSLSRRMSSDTGVLLERAGEVAHRVRRVAHAARARRVRVLVEELFPRAKRRFELAAARGRVAQLELHVGVRRVGLRGAAQLLGAVGVAAEPGERARGGE